MPKVLYNVASAAAFGDEVSTDSKKKPSTATPPSVSCFLLIRARGSVSAPDRGYA